MSNKLRRHIDVAATGILLGSLLVLTTFLFAL